MKSHEAVFLCQVEGEENEILGLPKGHNRKGDDDSFFGMVMMEKINSKQMDFLIHIVHNGF